jgi:hypothetical protein
MAGVQMMIEQLGRRGRDRQALSDSVDQVRAGWNELKFQSTVANDCAQYVREQLLKDKLMAFGYPPGATQAPSPVPKYLFENPDHIKWHRSSVSGNGLTFISVKIFRPNWLPDIMPADTNPKIQKRAGRPPSTKLLDIISELNSTDPSFVGLPRKTQVEKVRQLAVTKFKSLFPGGKGADKKTISRYLTQSLKNNAVS